jgi:hypothetical protein
MQTTKLPNRDDLPVSDIRATIILGQLSQKCKGKGICSITLDSPEAKNHPSNMVNAILSFDHTSNQLTIHFTKSSIKACTQKAYFNSDFFEVKEPFELTGEILNRFSLEQYHIDTGQYRITELDQYYTIRIQ